MASWICSRSDRTDLLYAEEGTEDPVERLKKEFEPQGIPVYPISAATGKGVRELLFAVQQELEKIPAETVVFEQEYDPLSAFVNEDLPFTVETDPKEKNTYIVEGPKIERMLDYTNLDSEKGFQYFQRFLKEAGILEELEKAGIKDGDTVRMYGWSFDYYK